MSTAVATVQPQRHLPSTQEWQTTQAIAAVAFRSKLLPSYITTEAAAIFIALKGYELGIPITAALSNISMIKGKPSCGAELMLALIQRDHGDDAVRFVETDADHCTIAYKRRSWNKPDTYTYTAADAKRAQLGGDNWTKYPAAMIRARCISAIARMAFADTIGGLHLPDELGASVAVVDGDVQYIDMPAGHTNTVTGEVLRLPQENTAPAREPVDRRPSTALHHALLARLTAAWVDAHEEPVALLLPAPMDTASAADYEEHIAEHIRALIQLPAVLVDADVPRTPEQAKAIKELRAQYAGHDVLLPNWRMPSAGAAEWLEGTLRDVLTQHNVNESPL